MQWSFILAFRWLVSNSFIARLPSVEKLPQLLFSIFYAVKKQYHAAKYPYYAGIMYQLLVSTLERFWIEWYFLNQSKVKPKSNVSLSHAFSCAWNLWHYLCTLSSDWLIKLFTPVVIGWSVYSSFGCKILTGNLLNPNFYLEKVWRNKQSPQTRAGQRPHYKISSKK